MNTFTKIAIGAISFFLFIFLYANELDWLSNTFQRNRLILTAVIWGIFVGLGIGYKLHKSEYEILENFQIFISATILSILAMPLFFSMANRLLSFNAVKMENVTFIRSNPFIASRYGAIAQEHPDGYHTYIFHSNELKRVYSREELHRGASEGEMVQMPIKKGLFGFEVVYPGALKR